MADITKIKHGSNVYNIKDADAARQEQADWNTNNGVKNLFRLDTDTQTINGITFTIDKTKGTVTASGTATALTTLTLAPITLVQGSYIINLDGNTATSGTKRIQINFSNAQSTVLCYGSAVTFTATAERIALLQIVINSGTTLSDFVFKPMLRPAFIEDDTFEPYAKSNAELTAIISDLQARVSVLENQ